MKNFIQLLPKAELHLHLEGSVQPHTAVKLIKRNHPENSRLSAEDIQKLYRFSNLAEFIRGMRRVSGNICFLKDLHEITQELLTDMVRQNVRYVEFDCAVQKYLDLGYSLADIIDSIYSAAAEFMPMVEARLIVNLLRDHGPEKALKLTDKVLNLGHPFVVGIGLSGDENRYPPEDFYQAFQLANDALLHRTAHAGEVVGPESVWNALNILGAERIDHGTTSINDDKLVDYLVTNHIPLTQCLTSNVKLSVVKDYFQHPFGIFYKRGVLVTLNTDDPQVFGVTLTDEYLVAADVFQLGPGDLSQIVMNTVLAAFVNDHEKIKLEERFRQEHANVFQSCGYEFLNTVKKATLEKKRFV
ncbi:adenosine deaminase [candidate division KSB1 bacterium]|nr:adenosine deaminase [candidate division KSB1 bacterium]